MLYILLDTSRCPFDLTEAESELVAGYVTEYSGSVFSLVFLCEYGNIIAAAVLIQMFTCSFCFSSVLFVVSLCLGRLFMVRLRIDYVIKIFWVCLL